MIDLSRLEVLAPSGDRECFDAALDYGADAIYIGSKDFGMRASPKNFTFEEMKNAVETAHKRGVKVYLTCNILPRNDEIAHFQEFIESAVAANVDAVIATDIGIMSLVKKFAPDMEIHISTQAGIVNYVTANEFYNMGAKRVVLARELSLDEIATISVKTPRDLDIEAFVHGAMCVSFSGRCLLSNYMVNRDANRGECAQPCRWKYHLVEEKRPDEHYDITENEEGTYIMNAKDMCMLPHIDKVAKAGVTSLKIEGRAKSSYYVSVVTNAYRQAVDILKKDPDNFTLPEWLKEEVYKVSHRNYCTGFFFGHPKDCQYYENSGYIRSYDVVGIVKECKDGFLYGSQRNKFSKGEEVEIMSPGGKEPIKMNIDLIFNGKGEEVETANHATMDFSLPLFGLDVPKNSIIRRSANIKP